MGSTRKTNAQKAMLQKSERDDLVLKLRMRGMDYRSISKTMREAGYSISHTAVGNIINARLAELAKSSSETAEGIRELEIRRLDALLDAIWPRALGDEVAGIDPDLGAVATALKVADRRAKLLGLDAPIRNEHSGPAGGPIETKAVDGLSDEQIAAELDRLREVTAT